MEVTTKEEAMFDLTPRQMLHAMVDEGGCPTYLEAYYDLVDMGEIRESESLKKYAISRDQR